MLGERWSGLLQCTDGAGEFEGAFASRGVAEHPVCGDRVQLSVQHTGGTIHGVRWRAQACPATTAVAVLAAKVLAGVPVVDAPQRLRAAIAAHGGLGPTERHAETVVLKALAAATGG